MTFLNLTVKAIKAIISNIINKIIMLVYLSLPLWVFLLIMQLRSKNNKTSAIGTFTEDNSEFQFIFPNYILVAVQPNSMKRSWKAKMTKLNNFIEKWKWTFIIGLVGLIGIGIILTLILVNYS